MSREKVMVGITMGDPAGVGPEVILRYFQRAQFRKNFSTIVIGDLSILEEAARRMGIHAQFSFSSISSLSERQSVQGSVSVLDLNNIDLDQVHIGQPSAACGRASIEYIKKAVDLCREGQIQAMVTAPISKEAVHMAGFDFAGHTELLAQSTNTRHYAMMLAGRNLRVVLVTTHAAMADVPSQITQDRVYQTIKLTHQWLKKFYPQRADLAVCGLNPHAGENGLFGREEIESITPAIVRAKSEQIPVEGPYPSDTLFHKAQKGIFGAVVVMYHDQGLIPLKMLAFDTGVNITLGLPIIRTSVDHGTAYDIAWQGRASASSLISAVESARFLAQRNRETTT
jgi:4-hydroxythreonine-4-phosphate dehydrogenase